MLEEKEKKEEKASTEAKIAQLRKMLEKKKQKEEQASLEAEEH